jgi:hypothetical protein
MKIGNPKWPSTRPLLAALVVVGLAVCLIPILPLRGASEDANSALHSRVAVVDTSGNRITPFALDQATLKYKLINLTANAAVQEVVAAVSGKKIVIVGADLSASTACTVTWYSAAAAISHDMTLAATGGRVWPQSHAGWVKTVAGEALGAKCQTGNCGILIAYREE